jgi:hypothetical protein
MWCVHVSELGKIPLTLFGIWRQDRAVLASMQFELFEGITMEHMDSVQLLGGVTYPSSGYVVNG